jgi:hypothetical protein
MSTPDKTILVEVAPGSIANRRASYTRLSITSGSCHSVVRQEKRPQQDQENTAVGLDTVSASSYLFLNSVKKHVGNQESSRKFSTGEPISPLCTVVVTNLRNLICLFHHSGRASPALAGGRETRIRLKASAFVMQATDAAPLITGTVQQPDQRQRLQ